MVFLAATLARAVMPIMPVFFTMLDTLLITLGLL
jgi:hypothetical protein